MISYLIKLKQNIFQVTLVTAVLLGISSSYLLSKSVLFFFREPVLSNVSQRSSQSVSKEKVDIPEEAEIERVIEGNFFRGVVVKEEEGEENTFLVDNLVLIGVLAGSPRFARAAIMQKDTKEVEAYSTGDSIGGGTITSIRPNSVILENRVGETFTLYLEEDVSEDNASSSSPKKTNAVNSNNANKKVEKITLDRSRFNQLIKNQAELFRLKFSPSIKKGKINGWRLLKVPKDHFLYSMGARSGDIIRRYNGQQLESQERMISMWQSLKSANQVSVDIERGNQTITYDVLIK